MKTVTLEYSRGSNSGQAIYLCETDESGGGSGHRIAGGKCWGNVLPIAKFQMSKEDMEGCIKEMRRVLKNMGRRRK
jgi:hypothetical protein